MRELELTPTLSAESAAPEPAAAPLPRIAPGKVTLTSRLLRDSNGRGPSGPLAAVLHAAAASAGAPLPEALRHRLEHALQADLAAVRLHTSPGAASAAAALEANAFTTGTDIYFAAGAFDPGSPRGQRLIAHEVAHVVQTGGRGPALDGGAVEVSDPADGVEHEAHAFADAFVASPDTAAPVALPAAATGDRVLRDATPAASSRPPTTPTRGATPGGAAAPMTPEQEASLRAALDAVPTAPPAPPAPAPTATPAPAAGTTEGATAAPHDGAAPAGAATPAPGTAAPGTAAPGAAAPRATRGGGGGTPAPTADPPAPATGGGSGPAPSPEAAPHAPGATPDGLVDYYMETHWSDARFMGLVAQHGYPGSAPRSVVTELDRWMPTDTPPSVRSTVNLVAGIGLGIYDSLFWSGLKAIPVIGPAFAVIDTIRQVSEQVGKYQEVGDWGGGTLAVLRAICDGGASIADNVANTAGFIESACFVIAGILGIGAVATALEGIGIVVAGVAAAVAEVGVVCKTVKVVARSISAVLNGIKTLLDYVLLLHNASKAEEAEANKDFERAGRYRQLMQGNAIDAVTDGIATIGDSIEAIIGIVGMGGGVSTIAKIGTRIGGEALGVAADTGYKWFKHGSRLAGGLVGRANPADAINGGREGTGGAFDDLLDHDVDMPIMVPGVPVPVGTQTVNLADQMRTSDSYVDPARAAGATGAIADARQRTVAQLETARGGLGNEPISWYQRLVNEIITPPTAPNTASAIADAMKPSTWIMAALGGMRNLLAMVGSDSLDAIAGAADTAAGWLNSKLQPVIGQLNQFLATAKPRMQQLLESANQQIQQSQLNLERVRNLISTLEQGAARVTEITGQNGVIEQKYQELMARADGWRVTRATLGLPASVPVPFVDGRIDAAIAGINAPIDAFKAAVRAVKAAIIDRIAAALTQAAQWVQQKMAGFRRQLSEGGAAHTALTTQYNNFKQLFDRATRAFAAWDGTVPNIDLAGAGAYLRQVAAAARRAREIESGQRPDPWKDIARNEGQPFVNTWRGAHGDQLRVLYQPRPDPAEMAAVTALYNATRPRATGRAAERLDAAYAACQAAAGRPGRRGLYALWAAENELIRAAQAAASAPPTPTAAPAPTAPPPDAGVGDAGVGDAAPPAGP